MIRVVLAGTYSETLIALRASTIKQVMFCCWLAGLYSSTYKPYSAMPAPLPNATDFGKFSLATFFIVAAVLSVYTDFPVRIAVDQLAALLKGLRMAVDGFDLVQITIFGHQNAVINRIS